MTNLKSALENIHCIIPLKHEVASILSAAIEAADPFDAVLRNITLEEVNLKFGGDVFSQLPGGRVIVVALGKAAPTMLNGASKKLGGLMQRGVCISKHAVNLDQQIPGIQYLVGNHPVPGEGSLAAGELIRDAVSGLTANDVVLLLLSGGGSALATLPVEGVTLADMQLLTQALLRSGASINEMNAVRKHLDRIKGGGMLRLASPARVVALVLSDVVGSPLDVIASGPAYPDPSTFETALDVVRKAAKFGAIPLSITDHLENGVSGKIPETVKPADELAENTSHTVVGSNLESCRAVVEKAKEIGFHAELITDQLVGEAREAGRYQAQFARDRVDLPRPYLLVFGGETTVTVTGNGVGGRNQEVALATVNALSGMEGIVLVTLATDGEDGPTDAAGSIVDGTTMERAKRLGLNPEIFLRNNDAYTFFKKTGDLLVIGPTGTNVNDISFIFGF